MGMYLRLHDIKQFDATRELFLPYGFTCEKWFFCEAMVRPDRHNEIEWNFLPEGSLVYLLGGRRVEMPARCLSVFWAGRPHQIVDFRLSKPYYVVTIPLAMFLQWNLPDEFVNALLRGWVVMESCRNRSGLDQSLLERWYEDLQVTYPAESDLVQMEMHARMRRLARTSCKIGHGRFRSVQHLTAPESTGLGKAEEIALFVAKNCTQPIHATDIGMAVGLHPDYAAAVFRRAFGVTLNQYLLENRMFHAQHLLAATDTSVLEVALQSGYQSPNRFHAAFKAICGCTPRGYRNRYRGHSLQPCRHYTAHCLDTGNAASYSCTTIGPTTPPGAAARPGSIDPRIPPACLPGMSVDSLSPW